MNLILRNDGAGPRHYLNDRPVHCGTPLQLRVPLDHGETWVTVRYEACFYQDRIAVMLHTAFGLVSPDENTTLRWPQ
jgi:hypothetical protein